jgi:antitoxin component YwqK of YwqJK toxin-antitoxin module
MKLFRLFMLFIAGQMTAISGQACYCHLNYTTDSLSQLDGYEFIAHVKITGTNNLPSDPVTGYPGYGEVMFDIIDLFKGNAIASVIEIGKGSMCSLNIRLGDEWIFFARRNADKLIVGRCDRTERYRDSIGVRSWHYGTAISLLKKLKELYKHSEAMRDGMRREYFPNGNIELEENILNGKLNGVRKIWYYTGELLSRQEFVNDTLDGETRWYSRSGQLTDESFYRMGKNSNIARTYYDTTSFQKLKRIQVWFEEVYDNSGRNILLRCYSEGGTIEYEIFRDSERHFHTTINYHPNGIVSSISYRRNGINFGRHQNFDENGLPTESWEYDEKGQKR